jgi:hypothetical protein
MGRKRKNFDYERIVELRHNEVPAKVNLETGEVVVIPQSLTKTKLPEGKEVWLPDAMFQKYFPQSWEWLKKHTTKNEYHAAVALGQLAKAYTNSLEPISDSTVLTDLIEITGINKNLISYSMHKLWKLGVYAKFEAYDPSKPYTKYWIFNPYLSFNGKLIDSSLSELFKNTYVAMAFRNIPFTLVL